MYNKKQYLDPRWQKKRLEILERDKWTCVLCCDKECTLHVHHRYYEKGKKVWEYPNKAYITLCKDCHETERDARPQAEEALIHAFRTKFLYHEILDIAYGISVMPIIHQTDVVALALRNSLISEDHQKLVIDEYFELLKEKRNGTGTYVKKTNIQQS